MNLSSLEDMLTSIAERNKIATYTLVEYFDEIIKNNDGLDEFHKKIKILKKKYLL